MILGLIVVALCALLYRAGGMGKEPDTKPTWIPMWLRQSWVRDWMIPLVIYSYLCFYRHPISWQGWLLFIATVIPTGLALSTYWDWLFGYDNFWFHGFMVGLGAFPLIWAGFGWQYILIRALLLGVLVGGWSKLIGTDWIEEGGRGAFIALTVPLLLIWLFPI